MNSVISDQLSNFVTEYDNLQDFTGLDRWSKKVSAFLTAALGADVADTFNNLTDGDKWSEGALRVGHIQGLIAKSEAQSATQQVHSGLQQVATATMAHSRKVFLVHGHDDEAKQAAARFLEKLGLQPIILHEQADSGRTIIEKFETYSDDVAFAVVLLTPDDVGAAALTPDRLVGRARQNVILELGYFMGRLGRTRVCALHRGVIELPSDYQGILYVSMDRGGAWRTKLAQELVQAKLSIDLNALVAG